MNTEMTTINAADFFSTCKTQAETHIPYENNGGWEVSPPPKTETPDPDPVQKEALKGEVLDFEEKEILKKSGVYRHTFSTPFSFEGKTWESMTFNFEKLTGRDIEKVEQEMHQENYNMIVPEVSKIFQTRIAARAAQVGSDVIQSLPLKDYTKITGEARNFLLGAD